MVNAPSRSIATDAGTDTEYGLTVISENEEKTCASHGKSLNKRKAIGRDRAQFAILDSQKSGREMPIIFRYGRSCICTANPDQHRTGARKNSGRLFAA